MSKQPPPTPTANATGPCPIIIQIVGCPGTGSLPRTIAPPDHPHSLTNPFMNKSGEMILSIYKYVPSIIALAHIESEKYQSVKRIIKSMKQNSLMNPFMDDGCERVVHM